MDSSPYYLCRYTPIDEVNVKSDQLLLALDFGGTKLTAGLTATTNLIRRAPLAGPPASPFATWQQCPE